ncbi:MAG: hydroxymethylglutaryl-CoA synthase [Marine Group III euryarchaeote CG-Epi4]|uniref:Hydroxymethylglutaryl-CoA synthase n=1 Tax=Marine Group III euryarchaeote CG-Epi4 TaxID=1888998 RepID=A0A1J5TJ15_9ARCH|nr:MAG: hydroxymethylglutaryl-CoA synthase [Marine Group III euryarchaeote CG-Epi4]
MSGIVSYGAYIPSHKIETGEIASVWGADGSAWAKNLNVYSKSVPGPDEDVITIAVEATRLAMKRAKLDGINIGAIYTGSESHPYAVKPTSTIVAEAIGATPNLTAADFEFACKAGTAAIQTCLGIVGNKQVENGIAIGVDTSQGAPGDALEYSASAGGGAMIIGDKNVIATINHTTSYTTDTPDFWRREGQKYPRHGGRFTGKPAFFKHVMMCGKMIMDMAGTKPGDYDYVVTHQPNGKFPIRAAKSLGFNDEQYKTGLLTPRVGNTYSGAIFLGLSAILDIAKPGDRILAIAYGSGAGSDGFDLTVTDEIEKMDRSETVEEMISRMEIINYATYAKYRGKLNMGDSK